MLCPGAANPPNDIGDSLRAAKLDGRHVELSWQAPPVDGTHDAATLYRIETSSLPDGTFAEEGSAGGLAWIDADAVTEGNPLIAYVVISENAGGPTP